MSTVSAIYRPGNVQECPHVLFKVNVEETVSRSTLLKQHIIIIIIIIKRFGIKYI